MSLVVKGRAFSGLIVLCVWHTWWRHQMETFSVLLAICAGNSPVPGEFPTQRPVTLSFDVYFDLRLNKRLSKQSQGWWFETLLCPFWLHSNELWRHQNGNIFRVTGPLWGASNASIDISCDVCFSKRFNKYLSCRWFETRRRSFNINVIMMFKILCDLSTGEFNKTIDY